MACSLSISLHVCLHICLSASMPDFLKVFLSHRLVVCRSLFLRQKFVKMVHQHGCSLILVLVKDRQRQNDKQPGRETKRQSGDLACYQTERQISGRKTDEEHSTHNQFFFCFNHTTSVRTLIKVTTYSSDLIYRTSEFEGI